MTVNGPGTPGAQVANESPTVKSSVANSNENVPAAYGNAAPTAGLMPAENASTLNGGPPATGHPRPHPGGPIGTLYGEPGSKMSPSIDRPTPKQGGPAGGAGGGVTPENELDSDWAATCVPDANTKEQAAIHATEKVRFMISPAPEAVVAAFGMAGESGGFRFVSALRARNT